MAIFQNRKITKVAVITLLIVVVGVFVFIGTEYITFARLKDQCLSQLRSKPVTIEIYFKNNGSVQNFDALKNAIAPMEGIRSVVFNSPSGLLDQFKEEHTNDPTMISALEKLPENPFGGLMRAVIVLEEFSNDGVIIAKIKDAGKGF